MKENICRQREIVVIGAGLTGLTTAYLLNKKQKDVEVIEQQNRIGGQIQTHSENGFTFESGPNTGAISYPEVAELFQDVNSDCQLEVACKASKCRLIWKKGKFNALPSGLSSAISTPLFTLADKFRILGEPFRAKGTDPNESVADLARRRLGKSFVDYAVNPFVSGVYAGDPAKLVTRFALPKLYNLEQNYGSFIRGSIAKAKMPKTDRDKLATKEVFSARGGLSHLPQALAKGIGEDRITLGAQSVKIMPKDGKWLVSFVLADEIHTIECQKVVTTVGAYSLPELLPFVPKEQMDNISNLHYAPIMEVAVGVSDTKGLDYKAFGGLVPSCEHQNVLGILFPSACFEQRAPQGGALYSCFVGGVKHADFLQKTDEEVKDLVLDAFHRMLGYPENINPDIIRIFRHQRAIPQYELSSGERFKAIEQIEQANPGLTLGGNIREGIGMADRIRQATRIANEI